MKPCPGPQPPRSWAHSTEASERPDYESSSWRRSALSLLLHELPTLGPPLERTARTPALVQLCLESILQSFVEAELDEISALLPIHLRILLCRVCAIQKPSFLSHPGSDGTGEKYIIGPRNIGPNTLRPLESQPSSSWDVDEDSAAEPIYALAITNARVSSSPTLFFPPSITHLALIHVSSPLPLHRLVVKIPLLVFLDLSYNDWLATSEACTRVLKEVPWSRLSSLRVLGLRGCPIDALMQKKVNEGRWTEIVCVRSFENL